MMMWRSLVIIILLPIWILGNGWWMDMDIGVGSGADIQSFQMLQLKASRYATSHIAWSVQTGLIKASILNRPMAMNTMGAGVRLTTHHLSKIRPYLGLGGQWAFYQSDSQWHAFIPTLDVGVIVKWAPQVDWRCGVEWMQLSMPDVTVNNVKLTVALSIHALPDKITMADRRKPVFYDPRLIKRTERKL